MIESYTAIVRDLVTDFMMVPMNSLGSIRCASSSKESNWVSCKISLSIFSIDYVMWFLYPVTIWNSFDFSEGFITNTWLTETWWTDLLPRFSIAEPDP